MTPKKEPKQIKCYCGHTTYCDCSPIETTPNKTNMTQQTAVEWLLDWMDNNQYFIGNDLLQAVEQAKEMEKEQMGKFANDYADQVMSGMMKRAEDYYNETYNQNPTSK